MPSLISRRHSLAGLAALCVLSPSAWAQSAAQITVTDATGSVSVPLKPRTVLVMDLAALDVIQSLGGEVQGIPNQKLPPALARYADATKYPHVGSLFEPDYEKIKAMKPDLIVAGNRMLPKLDALRKFAPVLDVTVDNQHQLKDVYRNIRALAAIYGVADKGEAEVKGIEADIASVHGLAQKQGSVLFLMTNGGKLSVYGPGSRFDMLYKVFGAKPVPGKIEVSNHGQAVSFEYLLKTNPDWLFVLDRDAAIGRSADAAQKLLDNKLVHATKAWRKKQVIYLDASSWYILANSSPASLRGNIRQISDAFSRA